MLAYVLRRLLWLPVVLLAVSLFTFALGNYGPGDPVQVLMGFHTNPDVAERIRQQRGLDKPFFEQYGRYIWGALHGDLGESYVYRGQEVTELLGQRIWRSTQLGLMAMAIALLVGIPLGMLAASRQGAWLDTATISGALFFYSLPIFVTAPGLQYILVVKLGWLPTAGWGGLFDKRIIMPALVMGIPSVASLARLMRASTLDVVGQDYVRTARSKGLVERTVFTRHIMRNSLLPILTVVGLSLATLVEGAFITETLFGIPGVGRLAVDSLFKRDYPVIMAMTLLVAVGFVVANLLVDIAYSILDPRIRLT